MRYVPLGTSTRFCGCRSCRPTTPVSIKPRICASCTYVLMAHTSKTQHEAQTTLSNMRTETCELPPPIPCETFEITPSFSMKQCPPQKYFLIESTVMLYMITIKLILVELYVIKDYHPQRNRVSLFPLVFISHQMRLLQMQA